MSKVVLFVRILRNIHALVKYNKPHLVVPCRGNIVDKVKPCFIEYRHCRRRSDPVRYAVFRKTLVLLLCNSSHYTSHVLYDKIVFQHRTLLIYIHVSSPVRLIECISN